MILQTKGRGTSDGGLESAVRLRKPRKIGESEPNHERNRGGEERKAHVQHFQSKQASRIGNGSKTITRRDFIPCVRLDHCTIYVCVHLSFQEDNSIPFKLNTAAILREGVLYKQREAKEIEK